MRYTIFTLVLFGWLTSVHAQEAGAVAEKSPLAKVDLKEGDSLVFLGDSITHQRLYTQYVEDYLYTRFPQLRLKIHNAGVGGARAWDALQRFDADVAAYKPKYVTILLGMNDGSYKSYDDAVFKTYQQDMTKVLDQLDALGAVPILITPTMFDARTEKHRSNPRRPFEQVALYNSTLAYYGAWLREVAANRGYGFADMYTPLNMITLEQRQKDPAFTLIKDAVHPDAPGQVVMATALIEGMGLPKIVSAVRVTRSADGNWQAKGEKAKVSELSGTDDGLRFTVAADSLPWVLPAEAELGVKLTKLGHRFSREALQIVGLPAGNYQLKIDGNDCGTFTTTALAHGVELQGNAATPQYQQALKVTELNKQRNEGPIKDLRGQWSLFQSAARNKATAERSPEDAQLRKQAEASAAKIEGMEERVAAANAAAKLLEDEIFQINQPRPHEYVLTKVK